MTMSEREMWAHTWAKHAAQAVVAEPGSDEALALLKVALELMPLEALIQASLEPGFAFIASNPEARRIMRLPEANPGAGD